MPSTQDYHPKWERYAEAAKERAGYRCQMCGRDGYKGRSRKRVLTVHHIDGDTRNNCPSNLIVLCAECHLRLESLNRKLIGRIQRQVRDLLIVDAEIVSKPAETYQRIAKRFGAIFRYRGSRRHHLPPTWLFGGTEDNG